MNRFTRWTRITCVVIALFCASPFIRAQENDTVSAKASQVENYQEQIKRLMGFLEFSMNTLGDPETSTREKEVIINESYLKAFLNDKVQIEDDLDENREMVTHKDVQAYLKDVDFFFKNVEVSFDVQDIQPQLTEDGMMYFKVTANRMLKGLTVEDEVVNNTKIRYIEINLDEEEQVLKIASIYTTKLNEKEEMMTWWNHLPRVWKQLLGSSYTVTEGVTMDNIEFLSDSTLGILILTPEVTSVDTLIQVAGQEVHIKGSDTTYLSQYDTIPLSGTPAVKLLMELRSLETLDVSGNPDIRDLEPVDRLSGLKKLFISNTLVENLFPVRNLTRLEVLDLSGTSVTDISPLKYNIKIRELYLNQTTISSLFALDNLQSLETLHFGNTLIDSLQAISRLPMLRDLRFEGSRVTDLSPLAGLSALEVLDLSGTGVTTLDPIQYLVTLKVIRFENTEINTFQALSKLSDLQVIDADRTPVSDLEPLKGLASLEKIYCDQSGVKTNAANAFMLSKPGVLVIYESEALTKWWNEMSLDWKAYFRQVIILDNPPTIEQLHALTLITSVDISTLTAITGLEPLSRLTNLKEVHCPGTSVTSLDPLKDLIDLNYLNCSDTRVKQLTPLHELVRLSELNISSTLVTELNGIEGATGLEVLRMDNTQADNLDSLSGLKNLRIIYCDETKVGKRDIDLFLKINPSCLIIYETPVLTSWWEALPVTWQEAFRSNTTLDESPTREQLHKLAGLKEADFSGNKAIETILPLNMLDRLEKLDLSNTMATNLSPLSIMINLKEISLSGIPVSDITPISTLKNLTHLDISNTAVDRLDALRPVASLEYLNCSGTPVKKLDPIELLFQLRSLEINNTKIKSLKPLEGLVALRQLKCFNTDISQKTIDKFKASNPAVEVVYY
jgi:hypothetical protein